LAEWQRIQLEELLSSRYNDMLPTIYITNLEEIGFRNLRKTIIPKIQI